MGVAVGVRVSRRAGAHIAVTGSSGRSAAAAALLRAELDGVRIVAETNGAADLHDADILLFVADAGETVDEPRTAALAAAARERGILIAALVVGEGRAGGSPLLAALRDASDMVLMLRNADDVRAVVAALR